MINSQLQLQRKTTLKLSGARRSYTLQTWSDQHQLFGAPNGLQLLEIEGGAVFVDGWPIVHPRFEPEGLTWTQKTAERFSSGAIHFTPDGMAFAGVIYTGADEASARAHHVSGVAPPTVYTTRVARTGKPAADTEQGVTVSIGYTYSDQAALPEPVILINGEDMSAFSTFTINPKNQALQLVINYDAGLAAEGFRLTPLWPASGEIEFSWDAESFTGWMRKFDAENEQASTALYAWTGQAQPMLLQKPPRLAAPALLSTSSLSLAELIAISPDKVDDLALSLMIQNMKWSMDEGWLRDFFGESKPALPDVQVARLKPAKDFYATKFAPAYLGWGMANVTGPGAPKRPLDDKEKLRLQNYLQKGLAAEKEYNEQNHSLYIQAFISLSSRLQDYIKDGGDKWAEQLYKAITTQAQLNLMVNRIQSNADMQLATRYSNLLAALQPADSKKDSYAALYQRTITFSALGRIAPDVKLDDEAAIKKWLTPFLEKFMAQYSVQPSGEIAGELRLWELAQNLRQAEIELGNMVNVSAALAGTLAASAGTDLISRGQNAAASWSARYPKLAKLGNMFLFAGWCYGLTNAIIGFKQWDNLSDMEKAKLVTSTVQLGSKLVMAIPAILETVGSGFGLVNQMANWCAIAGTAMEMEAAALLVDSTWMVRTANGVKDAFNTAAKAVQAEDTVMGKVFRNINRICKWLGVMVSAAFATLNTIEFVRALRSGDATLMDKAFTGIIACSAILETVCMVASLMVASQVFAVAGAVLAVIGLVFTLVEMFRPRPQPDSPVDIFVDNTLRPFIAKLPQEEADAKPKTARFFVQQEELAMAA